MIDDLEAEGVDAASYTGAPQIVERDDKPEVVLQIAGFDLIMEGSLLRDGKR